MTVRDLIPAFYLGLSLVLCLAGIAGFILLFGRDFNVYWLILSPVILALYQFPAVYVFWLYKRARVRRGRPSAPAAGRNGGPEHR